MVGARDLDGQSLRTALSRFSAESGGGRPRYAGLRLSRRPRGPVQWRQLLRAGRRSDQSRRRRADRSDPHCPISPTLLPRRPAGRASSLLDAARANPYATQGSPLAPGLALVDPEPGELIAFNAAPGTLAGDEEGPYGVYGKTLGWRDPTGRRRYRPGVRSDARVGQFGDAGRFAAVERLQTRWPILRLRTRRRRASSGSRVRRDTSAGRYPVFPPRTPTPPLSSETRSRAIASFSPPIRIPIRRDGCAPFSRSGERLLTGAARSAPIRRAPIGRICRPIRKARTSPTRAGASRCSRPSSSRRRTFGQRRSPIFRRRRRTNSSTTTGRSTHLTISARRLRRRRSNTSTSKTTIGAICLRLRRRSRSACCRCWALRFRSPSARSRTNTVFTTTASRRAGNRDCRQAAFAPPPLPANIKPVAPPAPVAVAAAPAANGAVVKPLRPIGRRGQPGGPGAAPGKPAGGPPAATAPAAGRLRQPIRWGPPPRPPRARRPSRSRFRPRQAIRPPGLRPRGREAAAQRRAPLAPGGKPLPTPVAPPATATAPVASNRPWRQTLANSGSAACNGDCARQSRCPGRQTVADADRSRRQAVADSSSAPCDGDCASRSDRSRRQALASGSRRQASANSWRAACVGDCASRSDHPWRQTTPSSRSGRQASANSWSAACGHRCARGSHCAGRQTGPSRSGPTHTGQSGRASCPGPEACAANSKHPGAEAESRSPTRSCPSAAAAHAPAPAAAVRLRRRQRSIPLRQRRPRPRRVRLLQQCAFLRRLWRRPLRLTLRRRWFTRLRRRRRSFTRPRRRWFTPPPAAGGSRRRRSAAARASSAAADGSSRRRSRSP